MEENHSINKGGRPKGSFSTSKKMAIKMREELVKTVRREFKPIIKAQIDLAKGHVIENEIKVNGKTYKRYYLRSPDIASSKYLLDQTLGKAKESLELSGEIKTIAEVISELDD